MITSRRLPHRRQSDKGRNCGAACLAMLLEHYKIRPSNLKEITSQVSAPDKNGQPMCYNILIARYAQKRGLYCSVVSVRDPRTFIPDALKKGKTIIAIGDVSHGDIGALFCEYENCVGYGQIVFGAALLQSLA